MRDSGGLGKLVAMNLMPNKVNVTVDSNAPGMLLWIEGAPVTAPATVLTWEGNPLSVMAPDQVGPDDKPYIYRSWSDGGRRSHNYIAPGSDATVTASFNVLPGDSFAAHADARVSEAYPTRNEGTSTGLSVKGGTSSDYETVIRFKLSNVGDRVYRARLYLYAYDPTVDGPSIYETSPSWSETGVTWNTRPAPIGGQLGNYGPIADNSWIAYDVTAAIDGNGYVAFVIRGSSSERRLVVLEASGLASASPRGLVEFGHSQRGHAGTIRHAGSGGITGRDPQRRRQPKARLRSQRRRSARRRHRQSRTMTSPSPTASKSTSQRGRATVPRSCLVPVRTVRKPRNFSPLEPQIIRTRRRTSGANFREGETTIHVAFDLNAQAVDPAATRLASFTSADSNAIAALYLLPDGSMGVRFGDAETLAPVGSLDLTIWNRIEVAIDAGPNGGVVTVWANGQFTGSATSAAATAGARSILIGGWATDRTYDLHVDNVAIDRGCVSGCPEAPAPTATNTPEPAQDVPVAPEPGTPSVDNGSRRTGA